MNHIKGLTNLKQIIVAWVLKNKTLLSQGHRAIEWPFFLGHIPLLRNVHPWMDRGKNKISYLPINESLRVEGRPMPADTIAEFIERTPYRVIMNSCLCRTARDCADFPLDIGCLFMGQSAMQLPPQVSRCVDSREALQHLEKAITAGLVPLIGKVRFDNFAFLIPDEKKLLSVCFCCPCCCMMGYYRHLPSQLLDNVFPRIDGLSIEVTDSCQGCGECAQKCYVRAIAIVNGRAVHTEKCRGCGRCARVCTHAAVKISLKRDDYQENLIGSINSHVEIR